MDESGLRVGVVGVGHLGRHHARILSGIDGVTLVGVADARAEQARTVAEPLGVPAYSDYRELLDKVDAVSVAVPTFLHREVAGAFLERGISTMVEKPLAANLVEAEELVALAGQKRCAFQVGHIERFNPALRSLDTLGLRPKYINAERLGVYTFRSTDIGAVFDLMIHDLDLILSLTPGEPVEVSALGIALFGGHEDVANARIWFDDGLVADVTASRASMNVSRKMRLWGAEGYASLDFATKQSTIVRASDTLRQGAVDLSGVDVSQPNLVKEHLFGGRVFEVAEIAPESASAAREPLALELEDFVQAVRSGNPPRVTGHDGLRAVRLADAILKSLHNHRWDGTTGGLAGPHLIGRYARSTQDNALPSSQSSGTGSEAHAAIPEPKLWRHRASRTGAVSDA